MKFALLIVGSNEAYAALSEDDGAQIYAEHDKFASFLRETGALADGAELLDETRIVTPHGEDRVVTSGPFAEAAEGLGGWYIVQAEDIDAAAELAKRVPVLPTDHVEVRPVRE